MQVQVVEKADVDVGKLARLTYQAMRRDQLLAADAAEEAFLDRIAGGIAHDCDEAVFLAGKEGEIAGWLALYKPTGLGIAQIWDWHPVVFADENQGEVAAALIQEAFVHLKQAGLHKVAIDFRVNALTQPCFTQHAAWYARAGITEVIEEAFYRRELAGEEAEVAIPDEYSLGHIADTDWDALSHCWEEVFSSSDDQFFLSLDAQGRSALFADSWNREKPLIHAASLTLCRRGSLIGFIRLLPTYGPTDGHIAPIGLLREYRGQGLAQALLRTSMQRLQAADCQTISCYVSTSNLAAVSFYEKMGFVCRHRIASLFGEIA
jgi:ribosomal protein S18 acetylase RimI-like enzyme